jgi:flagellar hook-associated protein 1 FlgK
VTANSANAGGTVTGALLDVSALATSDYTLLFNGGTSYTLSRESDGQTTAIDTLGASPFTTAAIDGFSLTITAGAVAGDSFRVRPVADSAALMSVAITSSFQVAAAAPVHGLTSLTNSGDGAISDVTVSGVTNLPLSGAPVSGDITITFDALNNELNLVPDPFAESPLSYTPAAESAGKTFTVLGGDVTFTVSGVPANGDTFILSHNAGGVADNRNALALAGIQLAGTLEAGTATLQEAYGQLITSVGVQTRGAQITGETFSSLLEQAQADRESTAGVNLDEEAADLIRFQQAYQAAARVVTIADSLFQTVLDAVRR